MLIGMPMSIKIADVHCNFKKRIMFRSDAYFFFLAMTTDGRNEYCIRVLSES